MAEKGCQEDNSTARRLVTSGRGRVGWSVTIKTTSEGAVKSSKVEATERNGWMPPRECKVCTSSARGLIRVSGRRVRAGFLAPSLRLTSSLFINQSEDLWQREEREGAENRLLFTIRFLVATSLWCWHVLHRQYEEMMPLMKAGRSTLEGEWCGQMGAAAECSYWW